MRRMHPPQRPSLRWRPPRFREALIRTLSVSLVAVAAIAASLLLARGVDDEETMSLLAADGDHPVRLKLDAIREAGL